MARIGGLSETKEKPAEKPVEKKNHVWKFTANGMEVRLTESRVKNFLVSGDGKDKITDQEIGLFINLCKYAGLNPWLKEAYCIKYGTSPATLVVGKDAFMKRAETHPNFDGFAAGIIVAKENGEITYRDGAAKLPSETVVGGWAEVYRTDRKHSTRIEVGFDEYVGRTKDGKVNSQWTAKPATMIRKVALVQALREAFPSNLGGLYTAEETGNEEPEMTVVPEMNEDTGEIIDAEIVDNKSEQADMEESLI